MKDQDSKLEYNERHKNRYKLIDQEKITRKVELNTKDFRIHMKDRNL
jgi:hypothetical protein